MLVEVGNKPFTTIAPSTDGIWFVRSSRHWFFRGHLALGQLSLRYGGLEKVFCGVFFI